jgi:hypothetical protein
MKVPEHFIALPAAEKANDDRVDFVAEESHGAARTEVSD